MLVPPDGIEPAYSSVTLPNLDEMASDHFLGVLDCRAVIRAMEATRRSSESSIGVQNIKAIFFHGTSARSRMSKMQSWNQNHLGVCTVADNRGKRKSSTFPPSFSHNGFASFHRNEDSRESRKLAL
jgi:hypothetical protein